MLCSSLIGRLKNRPSRHHVAIQYHLLHERKEAILTEEKANIVLLTSVKLCSASAAVSPGKAPYYLWDQRGHSSLNCMYRGVSIILPDRIVKRPAGASLGPPCRWHFNAVPSPHRFPTRRP